MVQPQGLSLPASLSVIGRLSFSFLFISLRSIIFHSKEVHWLTGSLQLREVAKEKPQVASWWREKSANNDSPLVFKSLTMTYYLENISGNLLR